jgi:hypothetical protein
MAEIGRSHDICHARGMTSVPFGRERRRRPADPWLTVAGWSWTAYVAVVATALAFAML